jgi:hypothetical protein
VLNLLDPVADIDTNGHCDSHCHRDLHTNCNCNVNGDTDTNAYRKCPA